MRLQITATVAAVTLLSTVCQAQGRAEGNVSPAAWHQPAFPVMAGDEPLDTHQFGGLGHVAPFVIDLDGDGARDLVIGDFIGNFYFYRNTGADKAPVYAKTPQPLMVGDAPARITNWCCMAVAPQFADVDGDGKVDLTAASYGGPVYWFKGLGGLQFTLPVQLLTDRGTTLLASPQTYYNVLAGLTPGGSANSLAANMAWAPWTTDDMLDAIIGNHYGRLFLWVAEKDLTSYTQRPGLPVYGREVLEKERLPGNDFYRSGSTAPFVERGAFNEILVGGESALPEGDCHAAPAVADWDGDGLFDILVGSMTGRVFLLRNSGKAGAPEFKTRELLIDGGRGVQWLKGDELPGIGTRSQLHVTDYNGDGKLDVLVGYHSQSWVARPDLTRKERKRLEEIRAELADINKQVGNDYHELSNKFEGFSGIHAQGRQALIDRVDELQKEAGSGYLVKQELTPSHGLVWVYLRK
jgi:hypothetical protein